MAHPPNLPTHEPPAHKTAHKDSDGTGRVRLVANVLTIIGLIILALVVIWGLIHLASLSGSWFSSLFGSDAEIVIEAPEHTVSGTPFTIDWSYEDEENGAYTLQYTCIDGLQIAAPAAEGRFQPLPCGASLMMGSTTRAVLLPILSGSASVRAAFRVAYMEQDEVQKEGAVTVSIEPGEEAPEDPEPVTPAAPRPSGTADLSVTIASAQVEPGGSAVVTFHIANNGSGTSDTYSFTAQLPTQQPYTYVSTAQTPLSPGSYVVNTIRFTQAIPGTIMVTVSGDSSLANNTASYFLQVPYPYGY